MFKFLLKSIRNRIGHIKNLEDDYEILSVLGQGSTSRVFMGIDVRDRHRVTIKLFKQIPENKIMR
jgi:serine/threonine protein kinase